MSTIFKRFMDKLSPASASRTQQDILVFVNEARDYIEWAKVNAEKLENQRHMMEVMAHHMGGFVWIKRWHEDEEFYTYEFANKPHCENFFGIPPESLETCIKSIQGRSDIDLLNEFRERTGQIHTYGDLCISTDIHARDQAILYYQTGGKHGSLRCTYLECGFIGARELVLEVTKTSLFESGEPPAAETHTFSIGTGTDVSLTCASKLSYAKECVRKGQGQKLQPGVYWLFPENESCGPIADELGITKEVDSL